VTARNPFHYGTPAEGDHFTGRREELDALVARMRDGINLVLISPRRYGKDLPPPRRPGPPGRRQPPGAVIEVDLLRAASPARFAGLLAAGAYRLPGARWQRARQAVPEFLHRLRLAPSVSFDPGGQPAPASTPPCHPSTSKRS